VVHNEFRLIRTTFLNWGSTSCGILASWLIGAAVPSALGAGAAVITSRVTSIITSG
jgi:hypothetical protein